MKTLTDAEWNDLKEEIERLKKSNKELRKELQFLAGKEGSRGAVNLVWDLAGEKAEAQALITELADKLDKLRSSFDFISESTWDAYDVPDLVQRAREAVK